MEILENKEWHKSLDDRMRITTINDSTKEKQSLAWSVPQVSCTEPSTCISRKRLVESRDTIQACSLHREFLDFENKAVSFIHRSAYDFVLSPEYEQVLGKSTPSLSVSVQSSLVQGRLKLLAAGPSLVNLNPLDVFVNRLTVFRKISSYPNLPNKGYEYLDELHDMMLSFSLRGFEGDKEESEEETEKECNKPNPLHREAQGRRQFWPLCVEGNFDYVQEHLMDIAKLDCRGIIFAELSQGCIDTLIAQQSEGGECSETLVVLLLSVLKELKVQYENLTLAVEATKKCFHFGKADLGGLTQWIFDISWFYDETAPRLHLDEIVCQMSGVYQRWTYFLRNLETGDISSDRTSKLADDKLKDVTSLIETIIAPWDIHIGVLSYTSEADLDIEISAAAFMQNLHGLWMSGGAIEYEPAYNPAYDLAYDPTPSLRIVYNPQTISEGSGGKHLGVQVVAIHDFGPRATARLLEFLHLAKIKKFLRRGEPFHGERGEYLECQKLAIDDVWENVDQELDAWQQLLLVASLKTKFHRSWRGFY